MKEIILDPFQKHCFLTTLFKRRLLIQIEQYLFKLYLTLDCRINNINSLIKNIRQECKLKNFLHLQQTRSPPFKIHFEYLSTFKKQLNQITQNEFPMA